MPTYSYACTECDNKFDIVQSFTDDTLTVCPQCSGRLRKLFNTVGIVFKGSGFYRNDSRGNSTSSEGATVKSEKSDSGSSSSDGGSKDSGSSDKSSSSSSDKSSSGSSDKKSSEKKSSDSSSSTSKSAAAS